MFAPLWLVSALGFAAEVPELRPNAVYVSGSSLLFRNQASLAYERRLTEFEESYWHDLRLRLQSGYTDQRVPFGPQQQLLTLGFGLAFIGGRHLDVGAGLVLDFESREIASVDPSGDCESTDTIHDGCYQTSRSVGFQPLPDIHVGYRYQKAGTGWVFRAGLGFPDGIYVSLGAAF